MSEPKIIIVSMKKDAEARAVWGIGDVVFGSDQHTEVAWNDSSIIYKEGVFTIAKQGVYLVEFELSLDCEGMTEKALFENQWQGVLDEDYEGCFPKGAFSPVEGGKKLTGIDSSGHSGNRAVFRRSCTIPLNKGTRLSLISSTGTLIGESTMDFKVLKGSRLQIVEL